MKIKKKIKPYNLGPAYISSLNSLLNFLKFILQPLFYLLPPTLDCIFLTLFCLLSSPEPLRSSSISWLFFHNTLFNLYNLKWFSFLLNSYNKQSKLWEIFVNGNIQQMFDILLWHLLFHNSIENYFLFKFIHLGFQETPRLPSVQWFPGRTHRAQKSC